MEITITKTKTQLIATRQITLSSNATHAQAFIDNTHLNNFN